MAGTSIVIPDDYPIVYGAPDHPDLAPLDRYGVVSLHSTRWTTREEFLERIAPAEVVLNIRAYSKFDEQALVAAPNLRLISILGTGTDNVDLTAASERGVVVTNTPGIMAASVAELAAGLMLAVVRGIPLSDRRVRQGTWQHVEGPELYGKTLGLLGLGAIGGEMARIGRGYGMHLIGWSFRHDPQRAAALSVELVDWDDLFRHADVLSIHLRGSPQAAGLVGQRELELMKPTAYLINTARAAILDQDALVRALTSGRLAGAGLDVFWEEPLPADSPLTRIDNVVLTPHAGAATREANDRLRKLPVDNIVAYLEGRAQHVVNPAALRRGVVAGQMR